MTGDDRSRPDDGLAPVTDLFGARSRRVRGRSDAAAADGVGVGPRGAGDPDSWAPEGAAGADELPTIGRARDDDRASVPDTDTDDASDRRDRRDGDAGTRDTEGAWLAPVTGQYRSPAGRSDDDNDRPASIDALRAAVTSIEDGRGDTDERADEDEPPMSAEEARAEAEKISMRTLSRRGVSTSELRTALRKRELDIDVIEAEVDRLTRVGLLDDEQLATDLVDRLHDRKGLGRQGVVAELRRRGIDQLVIDTVLAATEEDGDDDAEAERAMDLAVKRAGQMRGLDRETAERRLSGFLMRKGYGGSIVRTAVRTALDGTGSRRGGGVRFE